MRFKFLKKVLNNMGKLEDTIANILLGIFAGMALWAIFGYRCPYCNRPVIYRQPVCNNCKCPLRWE